MGILGVENGALFSSAAPWVDKAKAPGHTTMRGMVSVWNALKDVLLLKNITQGPNGAWLLIALASHLLFPYDIGAAKEFRVDWVLKRAAVNFGFFITYYGFFSVGLYALHWSQRKYAPSFVHSTARMIHNIWYSTLASLQLAGWEVIFMHMWAKDKLAYNSDAQWLSTARGAAAFVAWTIALPVLHDIHFYFIHRFIHIRPLYKYVHSLHHRNNDIEPFCGLCMHPIEHLYFFSILGLTACFNMAPFHFRWNLMWLMLAPGASHGGYEDVFNADQFHYLHHSKFECNYGSTGFPMDYLMGTARFSLDPEEKSYTGGASEKELQAEKNRNLVIKSEAKSANAEESYVPKHGWSSGGTVNPLDALPKSMEDAIYIAYYVIAFTALAASLGGYVALPGQLVAVAVSIGPVLVATLLLKMSGDSLPTRWPFHKESIMGSFGLHCFLGGFFAIFPVYQTISLALA